MIKLVKPWLYLYI